MHDIVTACHETCHLGSLKNGDVYYLKKVETPLRSRTVTVEGRSLPAYATGVGKALLADYQLPQLKALYYDGLYPLTEHTITDFRQLADQLAEIRASGFAYECEESTRGIRCIGVPLRKKRQSGSRAERCLPAGALQRRCRRQRPAGAGRSPASDRTNALQRRTAVLSPIRKGVLFMPQLITIGETMAAFTPDSVGALRYVQNFGIRTAGAESNVAVGLAKLGLEAAWVSRLGTDEFGCFIRNQLRAEGVDCSRVIYDPDHRTGIMFKETGVGETKVFYYRENSAASHLCPEDVTPALLDGVKVLHMSGITPVLSESCLEMTKAAFALAKEKGVAISFDPNIRRKLWRGQDYAP